MLYRKYTKRILDFMLALMALIILSPILLLSVIGVKLTSKGPILFTQNRLGKDGIIFKIYKLRTMYHHERINKGQVLPENPEITSIGRILRRLKIDELPQLFNILKGDMSIVGPRPCSPTLQDSFDDNGKARILVRPGLTGLAQTNGNIYLSWSERWKYDREYVETLSFLLDVKIILKTIFIVFEGEEKFKKEYGK